MLKELNSIAIGLLGLHGYPVSPSVAAGTPLKRTPQVQEKPAVNARAAAKSSSSCAPVVPVRARSYFAW